MSQQELFKKRGGDVGDRSSQMGLVAVVPAYNEEPTVGAVVRALRQAAVFNTVLVVDDGSEDGTAREAASAGATVLRTPSNLGKGGAMLLAFEQIRTSHVAFFDADLLGLRSDHVRRLVYASGCGYDMVAGYRDKGCVKDIAQIVLMPLITGERILKRWVLEALPQTCWNGYAIELALNDAVQRGGGRTALVQMDGVTIRTKTQKTGFVRSAVNHSKMLWQMGRTNRTLQETDGASCAIQ